MLKSCQVGFFCIWNTLTHHIQFTSLPGYQVTRLPVYLVTRLAHSLQSATRAYRAYQPEEMVVAALVHDIGDMLAPQSHSEMAAAVLRPFVQKGFIGSSSTMDFSKHTLFLIISAVIGMHEIGT